ncbi:hypothetical protein BX600DRAFT_506181 [Xylariales sp. PMI_506]|nr:hypothetical protein BX600DRAFT_506181 [Xylariales sp. PMI_506]
MPRPLRTSCDRCHSQKLKCPKPPGSTICSRCAKTGATCVFSPAGSNSRRVPTALVHDDGSSFSDTLGALGMDLDWPALDFNSPLISQPAELAAAAQPTPPQEKDLQIDDPRSLCVRQMSDLAVHLDETHSLALAQPLLHLQKAQPVQAMVGQLPDKYLQIICLERLFSSGQRLLEAYPRALEFIFQLKQAEDCQDPECIHHLDLPADLEIPSHQLRGPSMDFDSFLLNLLLLCHTRFTDILNVLLEHVNSCAKVALAKPELKDPELHIPELRVGSFVASPESSSAMQIVLLVHITSMLAKRAQMLGDRVSEATKGHEQLKEARLLNMQCEILIEGAQTKVTALQTTRDALTKIGFMKS